MFMNEYSHTIDTTGRMILPAKFREELGESFILAPGLDSCLCIYPRERWDAMIEKLQKLPFTKKDVRQLRRYLIGKSTEMECDKQGRILIPAHLRTLAKLKKNARIIGTGSTIEIWSSEVLKEQETESQPIDELAESLDMPMDFDF